MGRNFANKLWNASRFLLLNLEGYTPGPVSVGALPLEDRWILSRLATTASEITAQLEAFRISEAARPSSLAVSSGVRSVSWGRPLPFCLFPAFTFCLPPASPPPRRARGLRL